MIPHAATAAPLRVVVAVRDDRGRARLADQLAAHGHAVVGQAATALEAAAHTRAQCADVVLLDLGMLADGEAAAQLALANPAPGLVLLSADPDVALTPEELARTGAAAVLVTPTRSAVLENTVRLAAAQARLLDALRRETSATRQKVEERKLVDRAKGILMRRTGLSFDDAEQLLERTSRAATGSLLAVARSVLRSEPGLGLRDQRPRDDRREAR